ncbi:MAG: hypothetical protein H5T83_12325 [Actinotalea sp.]|nr:hypothetical protein [Actinotalea sp.]
MHRPAAFVLSLLTAVALSGCASGDEQPETATDRDLEVEDLSPTASPEPFDAGSDAVPAQCVRLSPSPDGRYPVGDAGIVTVVLDDSGGALVLEDVEAAEGWQHEVAREEDTHVDVRFTPDDAATATSALVATIDAAGTDEQPEVLVEYCDEVS